MGLGDCLVHLLVLRNAAQEISLGLLGRRVLIVRIARRHLETDIGGDYCWIVANRLEEDQMDPFFLCNTLFDPSPERPLIQVNS